MPNPGPVPVREDNEEARALLQSRVALFWKVALISLRLLLVAQLLAVAPGVRAKRMGEHRGPVHRAVGNVVHELPLFRVESGQVADSLRDLVIGARRVAAEPEAADAGLVAV